MLRQFSLLFVTLFLLFSTLHSSSTTQLNLTDKERAWLEEHPIIKIGVDAGYAPYAFVDKNGNFRGVASDFAKIIRLLS